MHTLQESLSHVVHPVQVSAKPGIAAYSPRGGAEGQDSGMGMDMGMDMDMNRGMNDKNNDTNEYEKHHEWAKHVIAMKGKHTNETVNNDLEYANDVLYPSCSRAQAVRGIARHWSAALSVVTMS